MFLVATGCWLWIASAQAQEAAFLSGVEDMPLMPGLAENLDTTLVFDSAEGRYVEAYAEGRVTELQVAEFYRASLPQLGWYQAGLNTYRRDNELLVIFASPISKDWTRVQFALSPVSDTTAANE